ncbi:thiol:disulfide interchange protein DsbG [Rhodoblastus sphagnicola]|uniref:hypothetical protein n=1 Tax=Rhodoblastus sphagnicola TaxID=333368 RepID=UPI0011B09482|nr:hypothetical protein [Rhodoblastus sphagnicola]MBB4200195.1 thiol:disulfide interchange protein DsbG [Rhodoblastus sphagnicola]
MAALASGLMLSCSIHALAAERCVADFTKPIDFPKAVLVAANDDGAVKKAVSWEIVEPSTPVLPPPAAGAGPTGPITIGAAASPNAPAPPPAVNSPVIETASPSSGDVPEQAGTLPLFKDVSKFPALKHIAATGATLLDLGEAHGLRSVAAKVGDQFMILQVAPDGEAVVGGPVLELSKARLLAIGGARVTNIGELHGLTGLFVRNGAEFQTLYVTPDNQATIAGVMWDSAGKNLTRDQVAKIDGALPTVDVGDVKKVLADKGAIAGLATVQQAAFGAIGPDGAPVVWMIVDPACSYSIRAFDALKPYAEAGRIQLKIVPISILDHEDNGMSTKAALSLLSVPTESMASAWAQRVFTVPATGAAEAKLQSNGQIAEAIKLTGTPTFFFRKPDGLEGRLDGMPTDFKAFVTAVVGRI